MMNAVEWGADRGSAAFSQVVDRKRRTILAGGHLTAQGADLVRGTVLLLREGHGGPVTLDLGGVETADDAGLQDLEDFRRSVTEDGGDLVVLHVPVCSDAAAGQVLDVEVDTVRDAEHPATSEATLTAAPWAAGRAPV